MKKKFRRLLCATLAILMLSILNINPVAIIAGAIASSGIGDRLSALFENIGNASKSLTAKADGDSYTYYNTYNYYGGGDEDSDAGSIATAVMEIKGGKSLGDLWWKMDEIEKVYLQPILDEVRAQNHQYRVAHLLSINNMSEFGTTWKPKYEEVPYVKDIAEVNGQFASVYTGSWDLNRSTLYNSSSRSMDSVVTSRAREVLGYDCDVRVEGLIFKDHGNETVIKPGATNDNTHTQDPQTATLIELYQQTMPKEDIYWIDAVTLLYKALGQEQVTYSGFMDNEPSITPETSPAFQNLSNPVPNPDGTYNGYNYYIFLTRNNTVVSDLGIDGVARGEAPVSYHRYNNYIYWNKALSAGFIPADKQKDFNKSITFRDFYQLAASMMQAYGEPVMNDDELKALLQVYGTHYPIQLGTDVADAWAYLAARGIFDFDPIVEGKESILYDIVNTSTISLDQLLLMCTRIKDKSARTDFKNIAITLNLSDVMKENYYFPVKDLKMSDSLSGVTTYDYTKRQFYDYLILKDDSTNLGPGALVVSTSPDDTNCIIGGRVDTVEVQGKEYYHIKLPITTDTNVYIVNTKVDDFGKQTIKDTVTNTNFIEIPADLPDGGIFSGSVVSKTGIGRTVYIDPKKNDYLKFSDLSGTDGTAVYCDSARAGRKDVTPKESAGSNTLLEDISFFINLWTTPMVAKADGYMDYNPDSLADTEFLSKYGMSLDEKKSEIDKQSGVPPEVKENQKDKFQSKWDQFRAEAVERISGGGNSSSMTSNGESSSGGSSGGSSSGNTPGGSSGNTPGGSQGSTSTDSRTPIEANEFGTLAFTDGDKASAYLTQKDIEAGRFTSQAGNGNKFITLKPGNNTEIKNSVLYYGKGPTAIKASRITALSDAGYLQDITNDVRKSPNSLWNSDSLSDNEILALAQYVYATPSLQNPMGRNHAVGVDYKPTGNVSGPSDIPVPPEPQSDPLELDIPTLQGHYVSLTDTQDYITEINTQKITKSTLEHDIGTPTQNWTWTLTSSDPSGAQAVIDSVVGAVATGNDLVAVDSELGATIYTSVIMNRNKQVLISWEDMVKNKFVTITKGLANDTPVPDDTGRYLFYAPETEGVIIVNDILKTIQVGTTVYDLSGSNVKHLVYHDVESNKTYFDIRAVVGVSEFDFTENKDAHISTESSSSLGSGSYAIWTYTTNKLFTKTEVNVYSVEERNTQNPLRVVLMQDTALDGKTNTVNDPNDPTKTVQVTYWNYDPIQNQKTVTRMKMSSFIPTANWCTFLSEGVQSTDTVGRCYIWYPKQPFVSGFIEVDQTDKNKKTLENTWDNKDGTTNYLALRYSTKEAILAMTDGILSSDGKKFEDIFKVATGLTVDAAMDPAEDNWYNRMNCASCADLWHYGRGKYFMHKDYIMRAVDISYNNAVTAYGNKYEGVSKFKSIEGPQDAGYMYFIDKIGYVYNLPYDEQFTYEKYLNGEYLLPLAINYDNGPPVIYNYNINFYSSYINSEGVASELPYGCIFTDKPEWSIESASDGAKKLEYPIVNARGVPVEDKDGGPCDSANKKDARNPFPLNDFVPAPAGVYAYIGYNNVQRMKLSEVNRYIADSTRIYYGASRLTYTQTSGATVNNRDIQFTLVSQQYPAIAIDRNALAQRVYQGKQDVFIIPITKLYASEGQGSYNITANDYGNTSPLMDWFSKLGLSDLLLAIDKGASWIVVFVFKVLPIIGVILMTILVGLAFLGDNKLVKEICEKLVDPVKILTFGRQTIETWKWQKVLLPCILLYVLFALFLNGNILRIIMWFASLGGNAVNWVMR